MKKKKSLRWYLKQYEVLEWFNSTILFYSTGKLAVGIVKNYNVYMYTNPAWSIIASPLRQIQLFQILFPIEFEFFITTLNFTNILTTWSNHLFLEVTGFQLLYVGLPKLATKCQHSPAHIGQWCKAVPKVMLRSAGFCYLTPPVVSSLGLLSIPSHF